ncbi:MAG: methyltransferase [Pseudomonadota bacterium]
MTDTLIQAGTYQNILIGAFIYMTLIFIGGAMGRSPYGRFASKRAKFSLTPQLGWFLMELPATLSFVYFYFQGQNRFETVPLIFLGVWLIHYGNRGFMFPFLMRVAKGAKASFGLVIVLTGWIVTTLHGYLNAVFISHLSDHLNDSWLTDPRFIIGLLIWATGYLLNLHSDSIIRNLRTKKEVANGEKNYRIPKGGLFNYITNASYFSEIISFIGFAIASWSLGALFVLGVTVANLVPRAFQSHQWYVDKFPDYPKKRKVLIPGIL